MSSKSKYTYIIDSNATHLVFRIVGYDTNSVFTLRKENLISVVINNGVMSFQIKDAESLLPWAHNLTQEVQEKIIAIVTDCPSVGFGDRVVWEVEAETTPGPNLTIV